MLRKKKEKKKKKRKRKQTVSDLKLDNYFYFGVRKITPEQSCQFPVENRLTSVNATASPSCSSR